MVKYGDESQSRPQKSPQVPPNMVQHTGTIVRDKRRWRTNMYRTKRLGLVLTPAEKAAVVQLAKAEVYKTGHKRQKCPTRYSSWVESQLRDSGKRVQSPWLGLFLTKVGVGLP